MSEEAIRAMEGTELAHVQARIQCLRNVRTLLDASMIQMQQYMNIVSTQRFFYFLHRNMDFIFFSLYSNMENGSRLLKNLNNDVNQVLASSQNTVIDENDTDLIRRRRLEHLANRTTSSPPITDTQDDKNDNNA